MAMQSGTSPLLEEDSENKNFTMKQHVDVLDKWEPSAGKDLRRKIKISDLLSPEPTKAQAVAMETYARSSDLNQLIRGFPGVKKETP